MSRFITLINFTEQGIKQIKQSPQRAAEFTDAAKAAGVTVCDIYWTVGGFDGVLIFDAPDETTAAAAMVKLGAAGNVRTQTLPAFDRAGIEAVLAKV